MSTLASPGSDLDGDDAVEEAGDAVANGELYMEGFRLLVSIGRTLPAPVTDERGVPLVSDPSDIRNSGTVPVAVGSSSSNDVDVEEL